MANSLSCVTHVKSLSRHKSAGSTQPELWLRPYRTGGSAAQEYSLISIELVREIYHDELITVNDISIDHFVPWSYLAHDEFWNLHSTTKSINSSKSNNLPDWDTYTPKLCELEYKSYELMNRYDKVRAEFERCAKEHLNSMEIKGRVYRPGLDRDEFAGMFEEIVKPVYLSAKNCGFRSWVYENQARVSKL